MMLLASAALFLLGLLLVGSVSLLLLLSSFPLSFMDNHSFIILFILVLLVVVVLRPVFLFASTLSFRLVG
jgi:hypothetical protein